MLIFVDLESHPWGAESMFFSFNSYYFHSLKFKRGGAIRSPLFGALMMVSALSSTSFGNPFYSAITRSLLCPKNHAKTGFDLFGVFTLFLNHTELFLLSQYIPQQPVRRDLSQHSQ